MGLRGRHPAHRRTLRRRPAGYPRRGRCGAGAQLPRKLADAGAGVGLLPRHRGGETHAEHVPRHARGAGRVLAVRPRLAAGAGRLATLRRRRHRGLLGTAGTRPPHRVLRRRSGVHQRAGRTCAVRAATQALVARPAGSVQDPPAPAVEGAHDPDLHLVECTVPAARPGLHLRLHPRRGARAVRPLLHRRDHDAAGAAAGGDLERLHLPGATRDVQAPGPEGAAEHRGVAGSPPVPGGSGMAGGRPRWRWSCPSLRRPRSPMAPPTSASSPPTMPTTPRCWRPA